MYFEHSVVYGILYILIIRHLTLNYARFMDHRDHRYLREEGNYSRCICEHTVYSSPASNAFLERNFSIINIVKNFKIKCW